MNIENNTRKYFQQLGESVDYHIGKNETYRVEQTQLLVPSHWRTILDVGCGDGRVTNAFITQGVKVVGIEWADTRMKHFHGMGIVADIRRSWPFRDTFDGAICAEVLEHLSKEDIVKVVANLKQFVRSGFIISVPARECLQTRMVNCPACGQLYHMWGHLHRFDNFDDVDDLIGKKSYQRIFVASTSIRPSLVVYRWRKLLGYSFYSKHMLCPFCSLPFPIPAKPISWWRFILCGGLSKLEKLTNWLRPQTGWFVLRYEI